jgi:hypothetical protein
MIGEKEMIDIGYVLEKNTPLATLNLSNNVIDPKAATVLAKCIGANSNLKELDLSNNKLGNCGIGVLLEAFIIQKLAKFKREEEKLKPIKDTEKKKKVPKLKMKLSKLMLNDNEQSIMALKHVYTVLLANKHIQISIDLPDSLKNDTEESDNSLSSSDGDDDSEEDMENGIGSIHPLSEDQSVPEESRPLSDRSPD